MAVKICCEHLLTVSLCVDVVEHLSCGDFLPVGPLHSSSHNRVKRNGAGRGAEINEAGPNSMPKIVHVPFGYPSKGTPEEEKKLI